MFDPILGAEDCSALDTAYKKKVWWYDTRSNLTELFRRFAFYYGPSISHLALRKSVLLCVKREQSQDTRPTENELELSGKVLELLRLKLQDPSNIDSGDLFAAGLLALWSLKARQREAFPAHANGVISIMRHLSAQTQRDPWSGLSVFWPLVRDQITTVAEFIASISSLTTCAADEGEARVYSSILTETAPLHQSFRQILGAKTAVQRQRFEIELTDAAYRKTWLDTFGDFNQLGFLRMTASLCFLSQGLGRDGPSFLSLQESVLSYLESVLVDGWASVRRFHKEVVLCQMREILETQNIQLGWVDSEFIRKLIGFHGGFLFYHMRGCLVLLLEEILGAPDSVKALNAVETHSLPEIVYDLGHIIKAAIAQVQDPDLGMKTLSTWAVLMFLLEMAWLSSCKLYGTLVERFDGVIERLRSPRANVLWVNQRLRAFSRHLQGDSSS